MELSSKTSLGQYGSVALQRYFTDIYTLAKYDNWKLEIFYIPDKQVCQAMNNWACIHTPGTAEHHHLRNQAILLDSHAYTYSKKK